MKKFFLFLFICAVIIGVGGLGLFWFKPQTFSLVKTEVERDSGAKGARIRGRSQGGGSLRIGSGDAG